MKVFSTTSTTVILTSFFLPLANTAIAQVTPDGTTSTTVTPTATGVQIDNGDRAGGNLFHSFGEFSIPTGSEAYFNNASDISNIFSRVTGGNISNIDGLIRANGTANLFLINPNGILFGENASLQLGGSFFGSTADSIVFSNGEFSATDLDNPPLITINAPIGLGFRDNSGDIVNKSVGQNPNGETNITGGAVGLQVLNGKTLAIIGGNVSLDDGNLTAKGGHIEISSVLSTDQVGITETDSGFAFNYDEVTSFGDITLQNTAVVDATANGGGSVSVQAKDLVIDNSSIRSGISSDSTFPNAQAGDIVINTSESVSLNTGYISNDVNRNGIGNSGGIKINTGSLTANNSSQITSQVLGKGNSGNVDINAQETVSFDSRDETDSIPSAIFTSVEFGGEGNGGDINIQAKSLNITNRAQLASNVEGIGEAGNINIQVQDEVKLVNSIFISEITAPDENGEGGGNGKGGNINITTSSLLLQDGSALLADTENIGDAGNIIIEASESVILEGEGPGAQSGSLENGFIVPSQITVTVDSFEGVIGNAGNIDIKTPLLSVSDNGFIRSRTSGQGNAGDLTINAQKINLNEGRIDASTFGSGQGGNLTITASEIELSGSGGDFPTSIFAKGIEGTGNAGNLTITVDKLTMQDESSIDVGNFVRNFADAEPLDILPGQGAAGNLEINANSIEVNNATIAADNANGIGGKIKLNTNFLTLENGGVISAKTTANQGTGGNIDLNVNHILSLRNNSLISAQANNEASGGNINIDTDFIIAYPSNGSGNDIIASAGEGKGGNIVINAEGVLNIEESDNATDKEGNLVNNGKNDIDASSDVNGLGGTVTINTPDNNPIRENTQLSQNVVTSTVETTDTCSVSETGEIEAAGLVVKGKGGVTPEPTEPISADALILYEETTSNLSQNNNFQLNPEEIPPYIQPVAYQNNGEPIYLARGVIVQEDGTLILTAYPTDRNHNSNSIRTPQPSGNCSTDN